MHPKGIAHPKGMGNERQRLVAGCPEFPGGPLSRERFELLSKQLVQAVAKPGYIYPWDGLEDDLVRYESTGISLVGYGSLINAASAAKTLTHTWSEGQQPAIAFGVRRLFHYEMPPAVQSRYDAPVNPLERGLLNAQQTGEIGDAINGIRFEVPIADIPALRAREVGYDLRPVISIPWERPYDEAIISYVLCCPDRSVDGLLLVNPDLKPHHSYYLLCRVGAARVSEEFLRFWLTTSYLADGTTCVGEWEVNVFPELCRPLDIY
jgi:hypothetical protein